MGFLKNIYSMIKMVEVIHELEENYVPGISDKELSLYFISLRKWISKDVEERLETFFYEIEKQKFLIYSILVCEATKLDEEISGLCTEWQKQNLATDREKLLFLLNKYGKDD